MTESDPLNMTPVRPIFTQEITMNIFNPEQFAAANKASIESLLTLANTALASAERMASLNLKATRSLLEENAANTAAILGAKDPQAAIAIQASLFQPTVEKAVAYSRNAYEISTDSSKEVSKLLEDQFGDFQKQMADLLDKATKNAPAGSEVAVSAVKSAIAAATSAFDGMNKAAKQAVEMAGANVKAATASTSKKK